MEQIHRGNILVVRTGTCLEDAVAQSDVPENVLSPSPKFS